VVIVQGTGLVVCGVANDYAIEERREYYDTIERRLFMVEFSGYTVTCS
jgi:hypothetical protein